ncbi:MAG: biopolymer transporter ExbD [Nitrospinota bacterium]|nr:MAG: biopolymer transporter ExbD [Nitrospinota bacterium]
MAGYRSGKTQTTLSEINVTPLVDVMLVLLIIFMVTAPMLQQGIEVQLPTEAGAPLPEQSPLVITLPDEHRLYLNDHPVTLPALERALHTAARTRQAVFLRADRRIPYGAVVRIMALAQKAGIENLGMVTTPLEDR